jgi:hypothetical protein
MAAVQWVVRSRPSSAAIVEESPQASRGLGKPPVSAKFQKNATTVGTSIPRHSGEWIQEAVRPYIRGRCCGIPRHGPKIAGLGKATKRRECGGAFGAVERHTNLNGVGMRIRNGMTAMRVRRHIHLAGLAAFAALSAPIPALAQNNEGRPADIPASIERCPSIADGRARLQCYERALLGKGPASAPATAATQSWRLVRTRNPRGGDDAVSMMRTADISASDLEFAGAMLRCGDNGLEFLLVVIKPFPPRSRPAIAITAGANELHFEANVIPPGAELLLPIGARALAAGPLHAERSMAVKISFAEVTIKGQLALDGLDTAMVTLTSNCPKSTRSIN